MSVTTKTIIQKGQASENHLTKRERDKLHRTFTYDGYVKSFARWAAFYGWLVGGGLGAVVIYFTSIQMGLAMSGGLLFVFSVLLAIATSGMFGLVALWHRGDEFRELMTEYELDEYSLPAHVAAPADVETRQTTLNGEPYVLERQDKAVSYGDHMFTFSGKQLDAMLDWYQKGVKKIRRDSNGDGPGLASIGITSANYSRAQMILKGRGLIDENSEWTARGVAWLETE